MDYHLGGEPVPGYRLEWRLGTGPHGEVWKATADDGRPCALKVVPITSWSGHSTFRLFHGLKQLRHPNVISVWRFWIRDRKGHALTEAEFFRRNISLVGPKELIIASELGDKSLADRLEVGEQQGIELSELLGYLTDAARGIDYLNGNRLDLGSGLTLAVPHCGVKPTNLLIADGVVKVSDHGLVHAIAPDLKVNVGYTASGPMFAPPEAFGNEPCPQSDQYSLAVSYYGLRTGRLPFDWARAIIANLTGQLDFSGVPEPERAVLQRATRREPDQRFASCAEFVEALRSHTGVRATVPAASPPP